MFLQQNRLSASMRDMESTGRKIGIVGAGAVGTSMAYAALIRGVARSVALMDINEEKVTAEALDLSHGLEFVPRAEVLDQADPAVCARSDVVIFTAGAKQKPGETRLQLAEATINLVKKALPPIVDAAPDARLRDGRRSGRCDRLCTLKVTGLPRHQLFGSGTVRPTRRACVFCSPSTAGWRYKCSALSPASTVVRRSRSGRRRVSEACRSWTGSQLPVHPSSTPPRVPRSTEVVQAAYRIIQGKGATNYAIGLASAHRRGDLGR